MDEAVYVVRQFNRNLDCLAIFGVYKKEETAIQELKAEHPDLEFNDEYWIYIDPFTGFVYRIDAFILK